MAMIVQTIDSVVVNRFEIEEDVLKFGRTANNQVQIDNLEVSNEHAQVVREINDEGSIDYFLEDLGSTNGSFINEEKIDKQKLNHKDNIRIGLNVFTFINEDKVDIEKTSEIKKSWIPGVYYTK